MLLDCLGWWVDSMGMAERRSETLVGVFVLMGLLALGGLIVVFGRLGDVFKDEYKLTVEFVDASGLIKGSEVRMGGARVGVVGSSPALTEDARVMVDLRIKGDVKLAKAAQFQIRSVSLLGDKMVVVLPPAGEVSEYLVDGDFVMGSESGGLDALQENAEGLARDARGLARDAKVSMVKLNGALDEIRVVAVKLGTTLDKVNGDVLGEESLGSLRRSMADLEVTSANFKEASKELKPAMVEVRGMVAKVGGAADAGERAFGLVEAEVKKLEPALRDLPKTMASVRSAADKASGLMERASGTLARIEKGEGLLGTLVYDKGVKSDAKVFFSNLKRYGVLGYKDDSTYDERDPKGSRYRGNRR